MGFYLAKEILGWSFENALVLAVICSFISILLDIFLFIIKGDKKIKQKVKTN